MPTEYVGGWPTPPNPTQAHVVEQARYCIRHSGGAEVSLTEISRSAHHSPSTLIYQFGSYAGLKDAIFVDITLDLAERIQDAVDAGSLGDSSGVVDVVAAELVSWTTEEPQAAEFIVRQSPTDLRSAVSHRASKPLRSLATALVPSIGASTEALDRAIPIVHQAMNMAIRFAQAKPDSSTVASFLDVVVRSADTGVGLLDS